MVLTTTDAGEVPHETPGCSCCGAPLREHQYVTLHCNDDVAICFHCLSWLNRQRNEKRLDLVRLALPDWLPVRKPHEG